MIERGKRGINEAVNKLFRREDTSYAADYIESFRNLFKRAYALSITYGLKNTRISYSTGSASYTGDFFKQEADECLDLKVRNTSDEKDHAAIKISIRDRKRKGPYSSSLECITTDDSGKTQTIKNAKTRTLIDKILTNLANSINSRT